MSGKPETDDEKPPRPPNRRPRGRPALPFPVLSGRRRPGGAPSADGQTFTVVRTPPEILTRQRLPSFVGISAETTGMTLQLDESPAKDVETLSTAPTGGSAGLVCSSS